MVAPGEPPILALFSRVPTPSVALAGLQKSFQFVAREKMAQVLKPYLDTLDPFAAERTMATAAEDGAWPSIQINLGGNALLSLTRLELYG
jgi:hypothetical protein